VWKTILPLGARDHMFGKWSPNWEGPFMITRVVPENAYFVETMKGEALPKPNNGKYFQGAE
jgi:hypothetical protein